MNLTENSFGFIMFSGESKGNIGRERVKSNISPCFQTEKFCSHYGCPINEEYVLFNRTSFVKPEIPFPERKSVIINEKCIRPLAEVKNE